MTSGRLGGRLSGQLSGRDAGEPEGAQGSTPEDFFDAGKLVDWWRADVGTTQVGGEIDTWEGQKLGVTLGALVPSFRCSTTAANSNFNNQPTIDTSEAGGNSLLVTGLGTPIWVVGDKPHILIVGRAVGYTSGTDCIMSFSDTIVSTRIDVSAAGTVRFRINRNSVNNDRSVAVTITNAALFRFGVDEDDGATGFLLTHNATTSQTAGTGLELEANVTGMSLGSTTAGANLSSFEAAEIVLLNDRWTAGELTNYTAYTLDRYGVPP